MKRNRGTEEAKEIANTVRNGLVIITQNKTLCSDVSFLKILEDKLGFFFLSTPNFLN